MNMRLMKSSCLLMLMIISTAVMTYASQAQATIVNLGVYENYDNADVSNSNVWVDATDRGSGVDFTFHNDSDKGLITNIYFEGTEFSLASLTNPIIINPHGSGVNFTDGSKPKLPGGDLSDVGGTWAGNLFSASASTSKSKIEPGEFLTISFDYKNGIDFSDIMTGLSDPMKFRMVQHVQGVGQQGASSVWTVNLVPLPATLILLVAGIPFIVRRRRI